MKKSKRHSLAGNQAEVKRPMRSRAAQKLNMSMSSINNSENILKIVGKENEGPQPLTKVNKVNKKTYKIIFKYTI